VVIEGETLFSVRGVAAYPAERRADEIAKRIRTLAANRQFSTKSLVAKDQPPNTMIVADGQRVMFVFDEDAVLEQIARQPLAELYRIRIAETIDNYRRDRTATVLYVRIVYALAATIVLVIVVYIGRHLFGYLRSHLKRRYDRRVQGIQDRAFQIVKADQIWRALMGVIELTRVAAMLVVAYAYLNYVLALFPWTRGLARSLFTIAVDPIRTLGLGLLGFIPNFAFLAILILFTRYALKLTRLFFEGLAGGTVKLHGFDPEWASPTYRLVRLMVIMLAIVVAYPYIPGSRSEAFKGVSLFAGIIFSLGSSSLIGNLIAGYSMTYRRAFKVGDRVKIGEYMGDVEQMRLLVTHLRTLKNEEVVVPNSTILNSEVVNYSTMAQDRGLILHTTVGIGYETPWRQVEAMLLEAAGRTSGFRREPPPFVLQKALGDFCVTYEVNVFCETPRNMESAYSQLHRNILDVFNEYGVQIMTPAYEHDPDEPKIVPRERWYLAPAAPPSLGLRANSATHEAGPGTFALPGAAGIK
jgi:small-conductance mechanosensitive channel